MITVAMLKSCERNDLRRTFHWLTKQQMGPAFGSRPVGWYQMHQCAALDYLYERATNEGAQPTDCLTVTTEELGNRYVWLIPCNEKGYQIGAAKRLVDVGMVYAKADQKVRT